MRRGTAMPVVLVVLLAACGDDTSAPPPESSPSSFVVNTAGGCEGLVHRCLVRDDGNSWICPVGAPHWTLENTDSAIARETCAAHACTVTVQSYPPNIVYVTCPRVR